MTQPISQISALPEEGFARAMHDVVLPGLAAMRQSGYFERRPGVRMHWEGYAPAQNTAGSVYISHGFTESAEKFRELAWYFLQMGLRVFMVDHHGHGFSHRDVPDMSLSHVDRFDDYVQDFAWFVREIAPGHGAQGPHFLYAHSMGGAIGALVLEDYPELFSKAVLNAPMIQVDPGKYPAFFARAISRANILLGRGKKRLFIHRAFDPDQPFERACSTSRARYDEYLERQRKTPQLQNSAATYRWTNESFRVTKTILEPRRCAAVQAKVLLLQAQVDGLVLPGAQGEFIARIPNGRLEVVRGAKHEAYRSEEAVLTPYLQNLARFYLGE